MQLLKLKKIAYHQKDSINNLPNACLPPDKIEVQKILNNVNKNEYLIEDLLIGHIMTHFKGRINPAIVREIVRDYTKNNT